jgi:predicted nucleic acid-binding protein
MITSIDTNVLLDILLPNEKFCKASVRVLGDAASDGSLVICDLVYAELCMHFNTQHEGDLFLKNSEIRVEPLNREAHFLASRAWRTYRKQGGQRTRIWQTSSSALTPSSKRLDCSHGIADFTGSCFLRLSLIDPTD